jgi:hypothetical protein
MSDLYFLKIFFIDKFIPYFLMCSSVGYLILELIAPKHMRHTVYDFADRLFFKFIINPFSKLLKWSKVKFNLGMKKLTNSLSLRSKVKEKKQKIKEEKQVKKNEEKKIKASIKQEEKNKKNIEKANKKEKTQMLKNQKREQARVVKNKKREEKERDRLETQRLKKEIADKLKRIKENKSK